MNLHATSAYCATFYTGYTSELYAYIHTIMYEFSKYLGEIDDDVGEGELFNAGHAEQIRRASIRLCDDICKSSGVCNSFNLSTNCFDKPFITKQQLSEWLYSAVFLLHRCSVPHMSAAGGQSEELEDLKTEKIKDQKRMIDLHDRLINF